MGDLEIKNFFQFYYNRVYCENKSDKNYITQH